MNPEVPACPETTCNYGRSGEPILEPAFPTAEPTHLIRMSQGVLFCFHFINVDFLELGFRMYKITGVGAST